MLARRGEGARCGRFGIGWYRKMGGCAAVGDVEGEIVRTGRLSCCRRWFGLDALSGQMGPDWGCAGNGKVGRQVAGAQ